MIGGETHRVRHKADRRTQIKIGKQKQVQKAKWNESLCIVSGMKNTAQDRNRLERKKERFKEGKKEER